VEHENLVQPSKAVGRLVEIQSGSPQKRLLIGLSIWLITG
jgi:hypothetical protein